MAYPLRPAQLSLWRMLPIVFQRSPLSGEGARLYGGRWNRRGVTALYLATDHATAVAEFYQGVPKPGTLAPYRLEADRLADLTDGSGRPGNARVKEALEADWKALSVLTGRPNPSWNLADELLSAGAEGALVPSVQNPGGTNLVLWRWHDAAGGPGEGAALALIDPEAVLAGTDTK
jgi:RES domain-containing protein